MATADRNPTVDQTEEGALPIQAQDKAPTRAAKLGQVACSGACLMNEHESLSDLTCEEQAHLAERELSSFFSAVETLYGPEHARLSAQDWLHESGLIYSQPLSKEQNWRAVTIAASARLADRLNIRGDR
jgi:hypothetical protein